MRRDQALGEIAAAPALRICNLGFSSRELYHVADAATTFYMLGSMGLASSIALGLALAQPRRVVAIDGDGSVLMNLGTLSSIGRYAGPNFTLVILDNGVHGSTGNQPTNTSHGTDLARVARACGVRNVRVVRDLRSLRQALRAAGPSVIVAQVAVGNADVPLVPLPGPRIRDRFRAALTALPPRPTRGGRSGSTRRGRAAPPALNRAPR